MNSKSDLGTLPLTVPLTPMPIVQKPLPENQPAETISAAMSAFNWLFVFNPRRKDSAGTDGSIKVTSRPSFW